MTKENLDIGKYKLRIGPVASALEGLSLDDIVNRLGKLPAAISRGSENSDTRQAVSLEDPARNRKHVGLRALIGELEGDLSHLSSDVKKDYIAKLQTQMADADKQEKLDVAAIKHGFAALVKLPLSLLGGGDEIKKTVGLGIKYFKSRSMPQEAEAFAVQAFVLLTESLESPQEALLLGVTEQIREKFADRVQGQEVDYKVIAATLNRLIEVEAEHENGATKDQRVKFFKACGDGADLTEGTRELFKIFANEDDSFQEIEEIRSILKTGAEGILKRREIMSDISEESYSLMYEKRGSIVENSKGVLAGDVGFIKSEQEKSLGAVSLEEDDIQVILRDKMSGNAMLYSVCDHTSRDSLEKSIYRFKSMHKEGEIEVLIHGAAKTYQPLGEGQGVVDDREFIEEKGAAYRNLKLICEACALQGVKITRADVFNPEQALSINVDVQKGNVVSYKGVPEEMPEHHKVAYYIRNVTEPENRISNVGFLGAHLNYSPLFIEPQICKEFSQLYSNIRPENALKFMQAGRGEISEAEVIRFGSALSAFSDARGEFRGGVINKWNKDGYDHFKSKNVKMNDTVYREGVHTEFPFFVGNDSATYNRPVLKYISKDVFTKTGIGWGVNEDAYKGLCDRMKEGAKKKFSTDKFLDSKREEQAVVRG